MREHTVTATDLPLAELRLIHDLLVTNCVIQAERLPAAARVEQLVGPELSLVLHLSLSATTQRRRSRSAASYDAACSFQARSSHISRCAAKKGSTSSAA